MSKTTIYYFSATGNSYAVARDLAKILDVGDPVSIPGCLVNEDPYVDVREAHSVGFVFPVQRATLPEMLRGFIQSMPINPNCYHFAVSTYTLFGSNEFWDIDELLAQKGAMLNYAAGIRMMGNVGILQPSEDAIKHRLSLTAKRIDEIATAVAYHQEDFFPRSNKLLGKAVRAYTDLRRRRIVFRINERCKKCGICAQVCPAQNIQFPHSKSEIVAPIRSNKCEACLACIHWCPASAISTSRRPHARYHNPTVSPDELHAKLPLAPAAGVSPLTSEKVMQTEYVKLDEELAAALRDDLLVPTDIDNWLNDLDHAEAPAGSLLSRNIEDLGQTMSSGEIAAALSDLDLPHTQ